MTVEFCVQHERMFASLRSLCGNSFPAGRFPRDFGAYAAYLASV